MKSSIDQNFLNNRDSFLGEILSFFPEIDENYQRICEEQLNIEELYAAIKRLS